MRGNNPPFLYEQISAEKLNTWRERIENMRNNRYGLKIRLIKERANKTSANVE